MTDRPQTDRCILKTGSFWLIWLSLSIYAAALLILSVIPVAKPIPGPEFSDKAAHAVAYGLLSFLLLRALADRWGYGWKAALTAGLLTSAYGAVLEIVQYFLPYRAYESLDLLSNASGAVAAQVVLFALQKTVLSLGERGGEEPGK